TDYGAFVDLGGIDGLLHITDMAWRRVKHPSEVLSVGDEVEAKVLRFDQEKNRVSLGMKQLGEDPWNSVQSRYSENQVLTGTVTRLAPFGAFVQLEPGIEGLVHISHLSAGKRIAHPKDVLTEGEQVSIRIISIDPGAKRISLEIHHPAQEREEAEVSELKEGEVVKGTVESVKKYGVFMALPGRRSGLLHVSEIAGDQSGDLRKKFPAGSSVEVQVLGIDEETGKISLSTKSLGEGSENGAYREYVKQQGSSNSLGTLADLLRKRG
ncbi:MAG: S1 RNA-binding domain-containing protein, partial [Desulfobacteraceae bacterium]